MIAAVETHADGDTSEKFAQIIMKAAPKVQGASGRYSLVVYAIDNVKFIESSFGAEASARVLGEISSIIRRRIRDMDSLISSDGAEFVLVAQGADAVSARLLAERIRQEIESHSFEPIIRVHLSFCVVSFKPENGLSAPLCTGNFSGAFA